MPIDPTYCARRHAATRWRLPSPTKTWSWSRRLCHGVALHTTRLTSMPTAARNRRKTVMSAHPTPTPGPPYMGHQALGVDGGVKKVQKLIYWRHHAVYMDTPLGNQKTKAKNKTDESCCGKGNTQASTVPMDPGAGRGSSGGRPLMCVQR